MKPSRSLLFIVLVAVGLLLTPFIVWILLPSIDPQGDPGSAVGSADGESPEVSENPATPLRGDGRRTVSGIVRDDSGDPVGRAHVRAQVGDRTIGSAVTPNSGTFRLRVKGGDNLEVKLTGFETTRVSIAEEGDVSEVEIRLNRASAAAEAADGALSGRVVSGGETLRGAAISCTDDSSAFASSDSDGHFSFPPEVTRCLAVATLDGYGESTPVVLRAGVVAELELPRAGSIAGKVLGDRGESIQSFVVSIESFRAEDGSNRSAFRQVSVSNGAFELKPLAAGTYVLSASAKDFAPTRSQPLIVRAGQAVRGVEIALARGRVLTGSVTDRATGAAIVGATVRLDAAVAGARTMVESARSNDQGEFELAGIPDGTFSINVSADGYQTRIVSLGSEASPRTSVDLASSEGGPGKIELSGIGATLKRGPTYVMVASVFASGPAAEGGVLAGDAITTIDGEDIAGMSVSDAVQRLRGQEGTAVSIAVDRNGSRLTFNLTRARVSR